MRGRAPRMAIRRADESDAPAIAEVRNAAAAALTAAHGHGHWSSRTRPESVARGFSRAQVLVAVRGTSVAGTLTLQAKKPWAIDVAYFTPVPRALYLIDMAVDPKFQRRGIGRRLLEAAEEAARTLPAQALRLDAYDGLAGAGGFYARAGMREVGRVSYRGVPLVYFERLL